MIGHTVGHIRLMNLIGEGGMGSVFAGFDETLEREVAVKVIRPEFRLRSGARDRFMREARVLSQLDHSSACTVYDYIEGPENDFLVMELVPGANLRKTLARELDRRQKLDICRQLLAMLVEVHRQGIIHRDLKPENIMVKPDGGIKVLDFGLCRSVQHPRPVLGRDSPPRLPDDEAGVDTFASTLGLEVEADSEGRQGQLSTPEVLTELGVVVGTAGYMSPEQARGEPATSASDMYSAGLIIQEIMTGVCPFDPDLDRLELIGRSASGERRPATGLNSDLAALVDRLTALAPSSRPVAQDALSELDRIADRPRRRRRGLAVGLALVMTTSLAVAAGIGWRTARQERDRANLEVDTLVATGNFLIDQFRAEEADELTARDIVTRAGERILAEDDIPLVQARMLDTIGRIHMNLGDYERGAQMLEESVRVKHERLSGDHESIAGGLLNLGVILNDMALLDAAESLLQQSLAMYRRLGDDVLTARSMNMLGCVYYEWRRYGEANRRFEEALQIAREAGRPRELLFPLNNVAEVQIETRDYSSAAESLSEAVEIAQQIGYSGPAVTSLEINLGKIAVRRGDPREGIARLRRVLADLQGPGPSTPTRRGQQGEFLVEIARGQVDLGEYDEAVLQLRRAIALLNDQRNPPRSRGYAAEAYVMLAEALIEQGEIQAAAEVIDQGKTSLEQVLPVGHPSRVMLEEFTVERPTESGF